MNEYILVVFSETREVIIDDVASGYNTGNVIEIGAGTRTISLVDPKNFTPLEQDVKPSGASPIKPQKVFFSPGVNQ